ncbi:MAG: hypothetical protein IPN90_01410 [Elusimicrobia bacterium]|nr:hypothetical protein [Elusimicrobiota bacterium]
MTQRPRIKSKRSRPDEGGILCFMQSGGFAGTRKVCEVPLSHLTPKAKAGLIAVRELKKPPPSHARDLIVYQLSLKGSKGKTLIQLDEQTVPPKARPLIAFLSAQAKGDVVS